MKRLLLIVCFIFLPVNTILAANNATTLENTAAMEALNEVITLFLPAIADVMSFFMGGLTAIAFVITANKRWL